MKFALKIFSIFIMTVLLPSGCGGQKPTLSLSDAIEIAQTQSYEAMVARISFLSNNDAI